MMPTEIPPASPGSPRANCWRRRLIRATVLLTAWSIAACAADGIHVTRAEYGASWPFTVAEGTLKCDTDGPRQYLRLDTGNGIQYGLNGVAKSFGFPDSQSFRSQAPRVSTCSRSSTEV